MKNSILTLLIVATASVYAQTSSLLLAAGSGGGFAIVSHASQAANGSGATTTSAIVTTGADSCYVAVSNYGAVVSSSITVTDSKSNTWSAVTSAVSGSNANVGWFYSKGLTVGSGHTFTATGGTFNQSPIAVVCVSGSLTSGAEDQKASANNPGTTVATIQAGSVTPTNTNQIVLNAVANATDTINQTSIDGGFTNLENITASSGVTQGLAINYLVQTTAVAANPTNTMSGSLTSTNVMAENATFKSH